MLHIVRNELDARRAVLILEGRIVGAWAEVLEHECREAIRSGFRSGVEVLGRLDASGVGIGGCSPLIADMLEHEGIDVTRSNGEVRKTQTT
jgi:hypothetical protein